MGRVLETGGGYNQHCDTSFLRNAAKLLNTYENFGYHTVETEANENEE